jgi:hypothetical protein
LPENRQIACIYRANDDAAESRDVAFSGVAAFTSRSDASWPPAGIIKAAVGDNDLGSKVR